MSVQIRNYLFSMKQNGLYVEDITTGLSAEKVRLALDCDHESIDRNGEINSKFPMRLRVVHKTGIGFTIDNLTKVEYELYIKFVYFPQHKIVNTQYY